MNACVAARIYARGEGWADGGAELGVGCMEHPDEMDKGAVVVWPERFPHGDLSAIRKRTPARWLTRGGAAGVCLYRYEACGRTPAMGRGA